MFFRCEPFGCSLTHAVRISWFLGNLHNSGWLLPFRLPAIRFASVWMWFLRKMICEPPLWVLKNVYALYKQTQHFKHYGSVFAVKGGQMLLEFCYCIMNTSFLWHMAEAASSSSRRCCFSFLKHLLCMLLSHPAGQWYRVRFRCEVRWPPHSANQRYLIRGFWSARVCLLFTGR